PPARTSRRTERGRGSRQEGGMRRPWARVPPWAGRYSTESSEALRLALTNRASSTVQPLTRGTFRGVHFCAHREGSDHGALGHGDTGAVLDVGLGVRATGYGCGADQRRPAPHRDNAAPLVGSRVPNPAIRLAHRNRLLDEVAIPLDPFTASAMNPASPPAAPATTAGAQTAYVPTC